MHPAPPHLPAPQTALASGTCRGHTRAVGPRQMPPPCCWHPPPASRGCLQPHGPPQGQAWITGGSRPGLRQPAPCHRLPRPPPLDFTHRPRAHEPSPHQRPHWGRRVTRTRHRLCRVCSQPTSRLGCGASVGGASVDGPGVAVSRGRHTGQRPPSQPGPSVLGKTWEGPRSAAMCPRWSPPQRQHRVRTDRHRKTQGTSQWEPHGRSRQRLAQQPLRGEMGRGPGERQGPRARVVLTVLSWAGHAGLLGAARENCGEKGRTWSAPSHLSRAQDPEAC